MKILKNQFKQKNVESSDLLKIIKKYSKRDCVKIALYVAEDNLHLRSTKESKLCIELVKKWLNETSVTKRELRRAINSARLFSGWDDGSGFIWATTNAAFAVLSTASMTISYSVLDAVANAIDLLLLLMLMMLMLMLMMMLMLLILLLMLLIGLLILLLMLLIGLLMLLMLIKNSNLKNTEIMPASSLTKTLILSLEKKLKLLTSITQLT